MWSPSPHCCGTAGIKPTSGRVPRTGHILPPGGPLDALTQLPLREVLRLLSLADGDLSQCLGAELKNYFPQALTWTGKNLTSQLACDFLLKWPTLKAIQRARPETVRKFYYGHNCRRGDVIEERIGEIRTAKPLTTDPAIVDTSALTVHMLANLIRTLGPSIARYEEEIEKIMATHPDAGLFESLPGAGAAIAPRLLAAFGTDRQRFEPGG